ncbi:MAG: excinuclease ABC subunit UvrA, partial [Clostridia bacterium]|nr:excinuclease ABC subunit UvrA [Clostridia bacterium]
MKNDKIVVKGAKENNLKNVSLEIPRDKFVVFTGVSGSGKSSLAFGTIFAEGQRRYIESLSSYARMFLGSAQKPDVEVIEGLSPAISIDQKTTNRNPRSTVGTVTEIYDYLRLLFARVGTPYCPNCNRPVKQQT